MGLYTCYDTFKGGFCGLDPSGIDTHFAHCMLIEQIEAATSVHKDARQVKSINDWVED